MALHPIDVAFNGVDLTIVGQHAEGLGQVPLRESVGRIALMIDCHGRHKLLILQVREEAVDALGQEHAFVDHGLGREGTDIKARNARCQSALFNTAAADEQGALKLFSAATTGVIEQDLLNLGPGRIGLFADDRDIDRHLPPAIDVKAKVQDFALNNRARGFLRAKIGARQEDHTHADGVVGGAVASARHLLAEKVLRHVHPHARAIAGLAVCVDGPAMPNVL